ncbi:MAG: hypothetical protein HYT93_03840 [Parcubacteria group bacterium]|nr:hypothetical protein [Parcubacteria group bacterium]
MISKESIHRHPESSIGIYGYRLEPGDIIMKNDVYDSTTGFWEKAPCPGLTISEKCRTVWVRPTRGVPDQERTMIAGEIFTVTHKGSSN